MTSESRDEGSRANRKDMTSWWQRLLLLAFGLSLLGLVEIGLRLVGLGGRPPLLLELEAPQSPNAPGLYEVNPRVAAPFFDRGGAGGETMVGGHRREVLALPKPGNTIRILMLGASTVEGFPLPVNLTSSSFLEAMLGHVIPDKSIEVINLGITAIASYPLREIGELAISELDPDLVIVYYAHNEFFGASGVASHRFLSRTIAGMWLRQALRSTGVAGALEALRPSPEKARRGKGKHLIEVMASATSIEPGADLHRAARKTLKANLSALIASGRRRHVPILLSTVVSLEKELAPIASFRASSWHSDKELEAFREALRDPKASPSTLLPSADRLIAVRPLDAGLAYDRARLFEMAGNRLEATSEYRRARDLDAMPWRASSDKNTVIRDLARETGTALADTERAFSDLEDGATTWRLFYDHVHPSLRGQALLAESLLRAIVEQELLPASHDSRERLGTLPDWQTIAGHLGAHPLERFVVLHKMATLFRTPPIGQNNESAAQHFEKLLASQRANADSIDSQAISLWEEASRNAGFALPISYFAGRVAIDEHQMERAGVYLRAAMANAYELSDEKVAAGVLLLEALLDAGDQPAYLALRNEVEQDAQRVHRLPGQPSALLARAEAALKSLRGKSGTEASWQLAEKLTIHAAPWTQAFLEQIPTRNRIEQKVREAPWANELP